MSSHAITVADLDAMAAHASVTFRPGDILLVRMGWTKWYEEHEGADDRAKYVRDAYAWAGVKGCEETLEWLWDHHFAAVASDNNGFEVVPMDDEWRESRDLLICLCTAAAAAVRRLAPSPLLPLFQWWRACPS